MRFGVAVAGVALPSPAEEVVVILFESDRAVTDVSRVDDVAQFLGSFAYLLLAIRGHEKLRSA